MTLEDAIKRVGESAKSKWSSDEGRREYGQIVEWLKELDAHRKLTLNSVTDDKKGLLYIAPIPCTKNIPQKTVKDWFTKLDEEVTEYKEAVLKATGGLGKKVETLEMSCERDSLLEEAADIMTVLASFSEALGADSKDRDSAQYRVNKRNHERGRN